MKTIDKIREMRKNPQDHSVAISAGLALLFRYAPTYLSESAQRIANSLVSFEDECLARLIDETDEETLRLWMKL